jgi:methylmalonyl-CoA/ethylmalonyl-CoA epimerase
MDSASVPATRSDADRSVNEGGTAASAVEQHLVRVDHIAIAVSNLEKAERWYSEVLGFRCIERRSIEGVRSGMISSVMQAGPVVFVLIQGTNPQSQVSRFIQNYGQGVQHIALQVRDLERFVPMLKDRSLEFSTSVVESPGLRQIFTRRSADTGLMLEFIERGEFSGFTQQNVRNLFSQLEAGDDF